MLYILLFIIIKIGRSEPIPYIYIYLYFKRKTSNIFNENKFSLKYKKKSVFVYLNSVFCRGQSFEVFFYAIQPISIQQHRSRYKHVLVIYTQWTDLLINNKE